MFLSNGVAQADLLRRDVTWHGRERGAVRGVVRGRPTPQDLHPQGGAYGEGGKGRHRH